MKSTSTHAPAPGPAATLSEDMQTALSLVLEAHDYAQVLGKKNWEFALELPALLEAGCSRSALRWLVAKGYLTHAVEKTQLKAAKRSFHRPANLSFATGTCFVLTPTGIAIACPRGQVNGTPHPASDGTAPGDRESNGYLLPRWNADLRELSLGSMLIKAFTQPAPNQERILAAFEEDGWPLHIDDPLPASLGRDGKLRLHDTITRLNRHQQHRLIHFRSDNNGEGIRWEAASAAPTDRH